MGTLYAPAAAQSGIYDLLKIARQFEFAILKLLLKTALALKDN